MAETETTKEIMRMSLQGTDRRPRFSRIRRLNLLLVGAIAVLSMAGASSAAANVQWSVESRWGPTNLPPGGVGQFYFNVKNIGTTDSSGVVTLKDHLPPGVTATGFPVVGNAEFWTCTGTSTVTCVTSESAAAASGEPDSTGYLKRLWVNVSIAPTALGTHTNTATVFGGGAGPCPGPEFVCEERKQVPLNPLSLGEGFVPSSFQADVFDAGWPQGNVVRQAGTHPHEMRVDFDINLRGVEPGEEGEKYIATAPVGHLRTVDTVLPVGLVGNPESTLKCRPEDFLSPGAAQSKSTGCPSNTQVGTLNVEIGSDGTFPTNPGFSIFGNSFAKRVPIYNLQPPKGYAADFGYVIYGVTGHIYSSIDPARHYAIVATAPYIPDIAPVRSARVTIWGVPGDPVHDPERAYQTLQPDGDAYGAPYQGTIKPLLSTPLDCGVDNGPFHQRMDTWQHPEAFTPMVDGQGHLITSGCDDQRIRFGPKITLQPTAREAGGPMGLDVHLEVPQRDQTVDEAGKLYGENGNVHGIDTPPIKKVVVTFPKGMTISTSAAQGLGSCTATEIGIGNDHPVTCPDNSQYGKLTLHTPILPTDAPMNGFIYIAKQHENPFDNFLSMYFVIEEPERGLRIKLPGKIDLDPTSGQIRASFDDLPQFPVSDMQLNFKGGVRAALVNPATCGEKTITAEFYSWADPSTPRTVTSSYDITSKPDGSPCVNNLGERPFKPEMSAGTVNPNAAAYSPFIFRMTRSDDDQEISQIATQLPPGLTSKIAGVSECSDAAIEAAANPLRTGTEETRAPSCPATSLIGSTDVGSGVGVPLSFFPGKIYLAGPYQGAPLSLAVITPAMAGPYDLGVIVVRVSVYVNPETTAVRVLSDPFPQIYQGIPVRLRDVRIKIDRPETMLNPTNCNRMSIGAHLTGAGGDVNSTADDTAADLATPFQVANCSNLGFKPRLSFKLKGGTERADHPALSATMITRPGDANLRRVSVTLPHSAFLDQSHIRTICTRVQFRALECPSGSVIGKARAWTPLLDDPVEGPVYLRSSNHQLPDLVMALHGQVNVELVGRIDSINGGLRTTFETVPDQPVSKFTLSLKGGGKGLLQNSTDLCSASNRANALIDAQNGKSADQRPVLRTSCGGSARKHKGKREKRSARSRKAG